MKLIDFVARMKRREHRPTIVIAAGVLAYLVFVSWPKVLLALYELWYDLRAFGIECNTFSTCLYCLGTSVLMLLCLLADLAIWVLSIFVSWTAFRKSRKKAYLFLLAYFLMPLVVYPTNRLINEIITRREEAKAQCLPRDLKYEPAKPITEPMIVHRNISLPVEPFLLLSGIWYLYKKEETTIN